MNAVAKVKEDVTEVELDNPSAAGRQPDAGRAPYRAAAPHLRPPSRSAAAAR